LYTRAIFTMKPVPYKCRYRVFRLTGYTHFPSRIRGVLEKSLIIFIHLGNHIYNYYDFYNLGIQMLLMWTTNPAGYTYPPVGDAFACYFEYIHNPLNFKYLLIKINTHLLIIVHKGTLTKKNVLLLLCTKLKLNIYRHIPNWKKKKFNKKKINICFFFF